MHKKIFTNGNMKLNEFKKKKMKWRKNTKNVRNNINPYKRNLLSHRWKSLNSSPTIFVWKSKQGLKFSVSDMFMKFYAEWRPWYCPRETRFYKTACLKLSIRMYFHLWNRVLKIGWLHNLSMWVAGLQLARNFWSPCWKKNEYGWKNPDFLLVRFFCSSRSKLIWALAQSRNVRSPHRRIYYLQIPYFSSVPSSHQNFCELRLNFEYTKSEKLLLSR